MDGDEEKQDMSEYKQDYRKWERKMERLRKVRNITDPHFIALKRRLIRRLGLATHGWFEGGIWGGQEYYRGTMAGIGDSLKIMEQEFTKDIENEEEEVVEATKEMGHLLREKVKE